METQQVSVVAEDDQQEVIYLVVDENQHGQQVTQIVSDGQILEQPAQIIMQDGKQAVLITEGNQQQVVLLEDEVGPEAVQNALQQGAIQHSVLQSSTESHEYITQTVASSSVNGTPVQYIMTDTGQLIMSPLQSTSAPTAASPHQLLVTSSGLVRMDGTPSPKARTDSTAESDKTVVTAAIAHNAVTTSRMSQSQQVVLYPDDASQIETPTASTAATFRELIHRTVDSEIGAIKEAAVTPPVKPVKGLDLEDDLPLLPVIPRQGLTPTVASAQNPSVTLPAQIVSQQPTMTVSSSVDVSGSLVYKDRAQQVVVAQEVVEADSTAMEVVHSGDIVDTTGIEEVSSIDISTVTAGITDVGNNMTVISSLPEQVMQEDEAKPSDTDTVGVVQAEVDSVNQADNVPENVATSLLDTVVPKKTYQTSHGLTSKSTTPQQSVQSTIHFTSQAQPLQVKASNNLTKKPAIPAPTTVITVISPHATTKPTKKPALVQQPIGDGKIVVKLPESAQHPKSDVKTMVKIPDRPVKSSVKIMPTVSSPLIQVKPSMITALAPGQTRPRLETTHTQAKQPSDLVAVNVRPAAIKQAPSVKPVPIVCKPSTGIRPAPIVKTSPFVKPSTSGTISVQLVPAPEKTAPKLPESSLLQDVTGPAPSQNATLAVPHKQQKDVSTPGKSSTEQDVTKHTPSPGDSTAATSSPSVTSTQSIAARRERRTSKPTRYYGLDADYETNQPDIYRSYRKDSESGEDRSSRKKAESMDDSSDFQSGDDEPPQARKGRGRPRKIDGPQQQAASPKHKPDDSKTKQQAASPKHKPDNSKTTETIVIKPAAQVIEAKVAVKQPPPSQTNSDATKITIDMTKSQATKPQEQPAVKRGRGRPKKAESSSASSQSEQKEVSPPGKRATKQEVTISKRYPQPGKVTINMTGAVPMIQTPDQRSHDAGRKKLLPEKVDSKKSEAPKKNAEREFEKEETRTSAAGEEKAMDITESLQLNETSGELEPSKQEINVSEKSDGLLNVSAEVIADDDESDDEIDDPLDDSMNRSSPASLMGAGGIVSKFNDDDDNEGFSNTELIVKKSPFKDPEMFSKHKKSEGTVRRRSNRNTRVLNYEERSEDEPSVPAGKPDTDERSVWSDEKVRALQKEISELQFRNDSLQSRLGQQSGSPEEIRNLQSRIDKLQTTNNELRAKLKETEQTDKKIGINLKQGMKFSFHKGISTGTVQSSTTSKLDKSLVKEREIELAEHELRAREMALEKREVKLKALDRELDNRNAQLTKRESRLDRWERKLKSQEKEIEYKEKQLRRFENDFRDLGGSGSHRSQHEVKQSGDHVSIVKRNLELEKKEADVVAREQWLAAAEKQLHALSGDLNVKAQYLKAKQQLSSEDEEQNSEMENSKPKCPQTTSMGESSSAPRKNSLKANTDSDDDSSHRSRRVSLAKDSNSKLRRKSTAKDQSSTKVAGARSRTPSRKVLEEISAGSPASSSKRKRESFSSPDTVKKLKTDESTSTTPKPATKSPSHKKSQGTPKVNSQISENIKSTESTSKMPTTGKSPRTPKSVSVRQTSQARTATAKAPNDETLNASKKTKQTPKSAKQTPKSVKQSVKAAKQTPKSAKQTPKSAKQTPKSAKKTPKLAKQTPKSTKQTPKSAKQTPKSRKETPKSTKQTPKSAKGTPKSTKQTPKSAKQTPKSAKETPKSETKKTPKSAASTQKNLTRNKLLAATGVKRKQPPVSPIPSKIKKK